MIPRKLVETAFRLGWTLLVPPILVPVLVAENELEEGLSVLEEALVDAAGAA